MSPSSNGGPSDQPVIETDGGNGQQRDDRQASGGCVINNDRSAEIRLGKGVKRVPPDSEGASSSRVRNR